MTLFERDLTLRVKRIIGAVCEHSEPEKDIIELDGSVKAVHLIGSIVVYKYNTNKDSKFSHALGYKDRMGLLYPVIELDMPSSKAVVINNDYNFAASLVQNIEIILANKGLMTKQGQPVLKAA